MKHLVRFAPLILATASLVGCGSTPAAHFTQTSSDQPQQTASPPATSDYLLALGLHGMATYDLEHDSARLKKVQAGDFADTHDVVSVHAASKTVLRVRSSDCGRYGCSNSAARFSLEGGQLKQFQFTWLPGPSLTLTGTGKYAVGTDQYGTLFQTYTVNSNATLLDRKTALPGYSYVVADPKADYVAAIALDPVAAPPDYGHGSLRLFRLYDNAFPTPLVETRVEPGEMTWNGDLIFIANRNLGSSTARGYALSAVHVVRDGDNETVEAHPREFWYIGDSNRITPSPDNRYLVAGGAQPGLFIYQVDPLTGRILNYPGVPLTGFGGDVSLTFDKDDTLLVADSDSSTSLTKIYRLTLSSSGEILETKFLGSHDATTAALVVVTSDFDKATN